MNLSKKTLIITLITYSIGIIIPILYDFDFGVNKSDKTDIFFSELVSLDNNQLFFKIVKNNISVIALNIIGAMTFGLLTFITTFYNGFILSLVIKNVLKNYSSEFVISNFFPHFTEVLAILMSCYLGYYLSTKFFNFCFTKERTLNISFKKVFYFTSLTIIITIISAILEAYVTIQ